MHYRNGETQEERNTRMRWWREARFGMFIHWGIYSILGGVYKGKEIEGVGEWIMHNAHIPVKEYKSYARKFNPLKYNPEEWVLLAKESGMKYIVITTKHHDGFALFDSRVTDWDVVDATPYGRDIIRPLVEACRRHNMRIGFYYSQAQDWCHAGGAAAKGHWDKEQEGDMDEYIKNIALPQVKEILSGYGNIDILWWDTPVDMTPERAQKFIPLVLELQPNIIMNNRLGGDIEGDFVTPEQRIPESPIPGKDWEVCMTMNDTWGYKIHDHNWKSVETLIHNLVDIASKGGNYLLNVGPTPEGIIPEPSVERLKAIGRWLRVNGESIYGTSPGPFKNLPWGRSTQKVSKEETFIFLHVFNWPSGGRLVLPHLEEEISQVYILEEAGKVPVKFQGTGNSLSLFLPEAPPDPICSVVVLKLKK